MVDPTLTISIDRTSLGEEPLVLSAADDGNPYGIVGYAEPALLAVVQYAGDSPWVHGSTAVSARWQQTVLGFDICPVADTETELRALVAELRAAVSQFVFTTSVTVSDADAETWRCDMGSIAAVARDYTDLANLNPVYPVTIPVYPIRVA